MNTVIEFHRPGQDVITVVSDYRIEPFDLVTVLGESWLANTVEIHLMEPESMHGWLSIAVQLIKATPQQRGNS